MSRKLLSLFLCAATLGLTIGCLYPERDHRRGRGPDQRRDHDRDDRGRERDRDHDGRR
ncbi:MAG: hypothetical protein IPP58_14425 [Holophagaceae bacterium]|uniref:Lipoprotein n=1 Tax=Candidatus Geothrix skivensis TaxID=2954439 RepID=A0A9D7XHR8_9BACT|nr:hypothetical protein [Candidatus Geothrix skivensis]